MFNLGKIAPFLLRAVTVIPQAVQTAEQLGATLKSPGADKLAAVVSAAQAELSAAEAIAGQPFAKDADVLAALAAITNSVVAFHTLIATKTSAAPRA
jgi:hypothetical protein